MQIDPSLSTTTQDVALARLGGAATQMARETVDVGGYLESLTHQCQEQLLALEALRFGSNSIIEAKNDVMSNIEKVADTADETLSSVRISVAFISETTEHSVELAGWVRAIHEKSSAIEEMLTEVRKSNDQIASIAAQVNVLAMNAKIEAARAGVAGKGFAIVAEAINDLSQKTTSAAEEISASIQNMANWMSQLQQGAEVSAQRAVALLERGQESDKALVSMERQVSETQAATRAIHKQVISADQAIDRFAPAIMEIDQSIQSITHGVEKTSTRVDNLVSQAELIMQTTTTLGAVSPEEQRMITLVQDLAGQVSMEFETAVSAGKITLDELFDTHYVPIPDTDPQQFMTRYSRFADRLLPAIQEPALGEDPRIVFCAAIDRNGYLPTHNAKFSKRPGSDPVWNSANCRNRRIFDDRVGLHSGRNEQPLLIQVYRRDMGGGNYALMRDLSSPIRVQDRHWGGLRLAYAF